MDERRDDVDAWLSERVKPLLPHPGAFERIRRRARRRKLGQAAIAAGGAAVIVAAAATVPQLIQQPTSYPPPPTTSLKATHPTPSHSPSATPTRSSPSPSSTITPSGPPPVPANFAVSSVTFFSISPYIGWVIGQAGVPGHCGPPKPNICTSRAITGNGGHTWQGGAAPVVGPPRGGYGVSQIRALDGLNAWAFGPQLYSTHDGGHTWTPIDTHGMRVIDLETVNGHAFAVWARCTGSGSHFAANCTSFSLYSTPAGLDQWAPVPGATNLTVSAGAGQTAPVFSSAQLALTSTMGYLLAPDGVVYSGPITGGAWLPAAAQGTTAAECLPGPAQPNGVPMQTMLATTGPGIVELCAGTGAGDAQTKNLRYSTDGGRTWQQAGGAPSAGIANSLCGTPDGRVLVATTAGIDVSASVAGSGPLRWRTVHGASAPVGFSYVGMSSITQGVAIPADQGLHAVYFTTDGGKVWRQSPVQSPAG